MIPAVDPQAKPRGQPTQHELNNANAYASAKFAEKQFQSGKYTKYFDPTYVELGLVPQYERRNVDCPRGLDCSVVNARVSFTEVGCKATSCYPFDTQGRLVQPAEVPADVRNKTRIYATSKVNAYCFDKLRRWKKGPIGNEVVPDTHMHYWDSGEKYCKKVTPTIRRRAENPYLRADEPKRGVTDAPPFEYDKNGFLVYIPEKYCTDFVGISFDKAKDGCYTNTAQEIGELFIGTWIREIGRDTYETKVPDTGRPDDR